MSHWGVGKFAAAWLTVACLASGSALADDHPLADLEPLLARLEQLAVHHPAQAAAELDALSGRKSFLDERAQLRIDLIRLLIADAQYRANDVLALATALEPRLHGDGDARLRTQVAHTRVGAFYLLGRDDETALAIEQETAAARRAGDADLVAQAQVDRARFLMRKGDFEQAVAAIADAERQVHGGQVAAEVAFSNALLAKAIGDATEALRSYGDAYSQFHVIGDRTGEADAEAGFGATLNRLNRPAEAIAPLQEAIGAYREVGDHEGEAIADNELALAHAALGQLAQALQLSSDALARLPHSDSPQNLAVLRIDRAALLLQLKRTQEAMALLEHARAVALSTLDTQVQVKFHRVLADAMAAVGQYRGAFEEAERAQQAERHRTDQLVARQLAAQRGRLESELLTRENALLRDQAEASQRALQQARRAERAQGAATGLAALLIVGAAVALWRQRVLLTRIARMAQTDPLTGVPNRRHMLELGQRLMQRCRQDGRPYAMLLLDLDGFKQVNDRYGHTAGDAALCAVVEAMRRCIRPCDHLGRYGGEEFAVLLPGADDREAHAVAERLRSAVEALEPTWAPGAPRLTLSGGIALANAEPSEFAQLLVRADRALYSAKNAGRNRIALAA